MERDDTSLTLRASLRAAVALDNLPGGIAGAYDGLLKQSFTTFRAVILATATDQGEAHAYLAHWSDKPLASFILSTQAACLAVIAAVLTSGDDDADNEASSRASNSGTQEPVPLREYFKTLYSYATGWLGWSPAETWAASPAEIEAAFTAHIDRLMKLTPSLSNDDADDQPKTSTAYTPEQLRQIEEQGFDPAYDRAGLQRLKSL
ncbi:hypothetical protein [Paracoccus saliphilus]|uniref:Phage tail assembly chaperone protein, TAC n=1 Tax=Paracoccus saliphilus TaxID=405559 RepID=A0ABY7SD43_9RHOB|nr:hypothetical protein [Paracoccus saliphilus]WCR04759.1 hypothetical protein JHX88_08610 [Paracoccus saliphilus]